MNLQCGAQYLGRPIYMFIDYGNITPSNSSFVVVDVVTSLILLSFSFNCLYFLWKYSNAFDVCIEFHFDSNNNNYNILCVWIFNWNLSVAIEIIYGKPSTDWNTPIIRLSASRVSTVNDSYFILTLSLSF